MEVLHPRCAGLDVHKDSVVACIRIAVEGNVKQEVRTFGTTTTALEELANWLRAEGCTHAAMEATGIYWKPVWHALEDVLELVLANAAHIKNVPGRKTDVNDATWIADLLAHGLIRGSFVPEASIQEMRALTRTRKQLVREKAAHVQRIQKTLEDANLKIASVTSNIMGQSGRAIVDALIAGETKAETLADLTGGRLKANRSTIVESLRGRVTANHRFLLKLHFDQVKTIEQAIDSVDKEVDTLVEPFRAAVQQLTTMPGISDVVAEVIVSEIGVDMSRSSPLARIGPPLLTRSGPGSAQRSSHRSRAQSRSSVGRQRTGIGRSRAAGADVVVSVGVDMSSDAGWGAEQVEAEREGAGLEKGPAGAEASLAMRGRAPRRGRRSRVASRECGGAGEDAVSGAGEPAVTSTGMTRGIGGARAIARMDGAWSQKGMSSESSPRSERQSPWAPGRRER